MKMEMLLVMVLQQMYQNLITRSKELSKMANHTECVNSSSFLTCFLLGSLTDGTGSNFEVECFEGCAFGRGTDYFAK